jgi:hypothetical protein
MKDKLATHKILKKKNGIEMSILRFNAVFIWLFITLNTQSQICKCAVSFYMTAGFQALTHFCAHISKPKLDVTWNTLHKRVPSSATPRYRWLTLLTPVFTRPLQLQQTFISTNH